MTRFAKATEVSSSKSRDEIERTLTRYGRDPDRLRDEIANGDRPPPPGWPGRVGTPTDATSRALAAPSLHEQIIDCLRQYARDMMFPNLDHGQRARRIEWIHGVLRSMGET